MAFEETAAELTANVKSLGFDLADLIACKKLAVDYVHIERSEIQETGDYDLDGLFIRLAYAIDSFGAKRVVLDTIEFLFSGLDNTSVLRSELRRLFRWLKEKGVTVVITGERGDGTLTRHGLEKYVSDCVILLDHRVNEQVFTRRLRVVKYRGSAHGTNELPFLIDDGGLTVVPITSAGMDHPASTERVSTGVEALDGMLSDGGYLRGSSVLISGTAGTGKTSLAGHFAAAACARDGKCLYFSFEESPKQLIRNLLSIGLDLQPWVESGQLQIHSSRPTRFGLEMHLAMIQKLVDVVKPTVVVIDPISNFIASGTASEAGTMLVRIVDLLKTLGIITLFTNLIHGNADAETTDMSISSIIDTWLLLRVIEQQGEHGQALYILKSRGMPHSKQVRRFRLTDSGVELSDAVPSQWRASQEGAFS